MARTRILVLETSATAKALFAGALEQNVSLAVFPGFGEHPKGIEGWLAHFEPDLAEGQPPICNEDEQLVLLDTCGWMIAVPKEHLYTFVQE